MNVDIKMKFRDFVFPINPNIIRISREKRTHQTNTAYGGVTLRDIGANPLVISGEGEFFGEHCTESFAELQQTMGSTGILTIPSQEPVNACLQSLELVFSDIENVIQYRFRFIEILSEPTEIPVVYTDGNSCLWDYAIRYHLCIDTLVRLNPHVPRPDRPIAPNERIFLC